MEDEYKIKEILKENNVDTNVVLPLLNAQLDKICGDYMSSHDEITKSAFTEMVCYLQMALLDHDRKGEDLKARIQKIIDAV